MSSTPDFPAFEPEPSPAHDEDWTPAPAEMANDHPSAIAIAMDGASAEVIERVGFCITSPREQGERYGHPEGPRSTAGLCGTGTVLLYRQYF